jgi:hypothetical protein
MSMTSVSPKTFHYQVNIPIPILIFWLYIDAVKASACFYTGYFITRYMVPKASSEDDLESLTYHFCNNYMTTMPLRTSFVETLMETSTDSFTSTCMTLLTTTEGINMWYDPIDPMISISDSEVCDIHMKLFTALRTRGITSLAEYTTFSYLITLDLYFTAN